MGLMAREGLTSECLQLTADFELVVVGFAQSDKVNNSGCEVQHDVLRVSLHDGDRETIAVGRSRHATGEYHVSSSTVTTNTITSMHLSMKPAS